VSARYEIRLTGPLDAESVESLREVDVDVTTYGRTTLVRGDLDQPALHGLLERIRARHLQLDELRRVRDLPAPR
jgi:hypothetical protein